MRSYSVHTLGRRLHHEVSHPSTLVQLLYSMAVSAFLNLSKDYTNVPQFSSANILLTPFRTQNVPPPMSSYQLLLSVFDPLYTTPRIPTYTAFSLNMDILAVLWESGYLQVSDLRTRLGPGKGKVMDSNMLWAGPVSDVDAAIGANTRVYRQVVFWQTAEVDVSVVQLVVLGANLTGNTNDVIFIVAIEKSKMVNCLEVTMSGRNGTLVPSDQGITWQSPNGEIYVGMFSRSPYTVQF